MGKTAEPNTNYCGGFTQGAISVNGQVFTTENPPISYTLSGKTATISDATGVIGEADLSGDLIESSRVKASPGVEYCDIPYAELKIGNSTFGTDNTPISYSLKTKALLVNGQLLNLIKEIQSWTTQQQTEGIRVDWGGGDVDILTGTTWEISSLISLSMAQKAWYRLQATSLSDGAKIFRWAFDVIELDPNTGIFKSKGTASGGTAAADLPCIGAWCTGTNYTTSSLTFNAASSLLEIIEIGKYCCGSEPVISGYKVTTNTGATSQRTTINPPTVSQQPGDCLLEVTYTDNTTQSFTYAECPTVEPVQCAEVSNSNGVMGEACPFNGEATAICYDYDITEVKYVCEGACPSAEFECRCETSNTLMCYGWDPNDPDIFKPLFTTSITSG